MKLKICGLTQPSDIDTANELQLDYIGFVFAKSRRQVTDAQALTLKARLSPDVQAVGVFVNDTVEHIAALAAAGAIDLVQLHGDEDSAYLARLRQQVSLPIIRAVRVQTAEQISAAAQTDADYLLLDTYQKDSYGGSGTVFDWSLIPPIAKPFFLAGGLSEENIGQALQTGAYALDLSGGAETNGKKDPAKMRRIAALVRRNNRNE